MVFVELGQVEDAAPLRPPTAVTNHVQAVGFGDSAVRVTRPLTPPCQSAIFRFSNSNNFEILIRAAPDSDSSRGTGTHSHERLYLLLGATQSAHNERRSV